MNKIRSFKYIVNAYLALLLFPFGKKRKNLWLIGGHNGKLYTDNAKVFYEYMLATHPEVDIYWIVDKNAPAFEAIRGKKLIKGSIRAYGYFYRAEVVLFSDTLNSDIAPFSFVLPWVKRFYGQTCKVYLSHGTIAFKKMPKYKGALATLKKAIWQSYDLAIASSDLSKKAMIGYNIQEKNIVIAGNARDDLLTHQPSTQRSILVAPTWRSWLAHTPTLEKSDFFRHYAALLSDTTLITYLKRHNIILYFYLHHMFHTHIEVFKPLQNETIQILPAKTAIAAILSTSELMVTDYSSLCADFYYLQKPVLFFQFDREMFLQHTGSEIDLHNDTFGDVVFQSDRLVEKIIDTLEAKNPITPLQKAGEKYFIHFKDNHNCHRIYKAIQQKLEERKR